MMEASSKDTPTVSRPTSRGKTMCGDHSAPYSLLSSSTALLSSRTEVLSSRTAVLSSSTSVLSSRDCRLPTSYFLLSSRGPPLPLRLVRHLTREVERHDNQRPKQKRERKIADH